MVPPVCRRPEATSVDCGDTTGHGSWCRYPYHSGRAMVSGISVDRMGRWRTKVGGEEWTKGQSRQGNRPPPPASALVIQPVFAPSTPWTAATSQPSWVTVAERPHGTGEGHPPYGGAEGERRLDDSALGWLTPFRGTPPPRQVSVSLVRRAPSVSAPLARPSGAARALGRNTSASCDQALGGAGSWRVGPTHATDPRQP